MSRRNLVWLAWLLAPLLTAGKCGGGDGSGGSPARFETRSVDPRCVSLPDPGMFPPDYDFVPPAGGAPAPTRVVVATETLANLVPYDIESTPFSSPPGTFVYALPADSDGDGFSELFKAIGDVVVVSPSLALVTASGGFEGVLFVDPLAVGSRTATLDIPAGFDPATFTAFPGLPAPGTSRLRRGVTATACIDAGVDALDSRGERLEDAVAPIFQCNGPGTFPASFTASTAAIGGRLFAVLSNLGVDQGRANTQFLPGAVVVYDFDATSTPLSVSPTASTPSGLPYLITTGFNPSHATPFTTRGGRRLLLVSHTGAIGIRPDDPNTDEIEAGAIPITDGVIDVIDVDALEIVATIPLARANPAFEGLVVDPTRRIALFGDVGARQVYGIDLDVVAAAPAPGSPGLPQPLPDAVIFDGLNPIVVPALVGGAPSRTCPGQIAGLDFNEAGDAAYVLEACDGTITALAVDLSVNPSTSALRSRVTFSSLSPVVAPVRADTLGRFRRPASLRVRPGRPGLDYAGPDVFFTVSDPFALFCGVRIDAP